jgi:hypothetical protein
MSAVPPGRVELPPRLRGVFFDWVWDTPKVWALPTETSLLAIDDLVWHLDLTVWTTVRGEARFDLAPATVLATPGAHVRHWRKIQSVDLAYPLELFRSGNRWVILDGYHRLCGHSLRGNSQVPVRLHPDAYRENVTTWTSAMPPLPTATPSPPCLPSSVTRCSRQR